LHQIRLKPLRRIGGKTMATRWRTIEVGFTFADGMRPSFLLMKVGGRELWAVASGGRRGEPPVGQVRCAPLRLSTILIIKRVGPSGWVRSSPDDCRTDLMQ
jgi:hypothetical protein